MADFETYERNGRQYLRVTSVLGEKNKPQLLFWYGKHGTAWCKQEMERTATQGTKAHKALEQYFKTARCSFSDESPEIQKAVQKAMVWADQMKVEIASPEDVELTVFHDEDGVAGTIDLKCKLLGRPSIVDWKFGKSIYDTYAWQESAYRECLNFQLGQDIPWDRWTLRFGIDNDDFEARKWNESVAEESHIVCYHGFKGLLASYKASHKKTVGALYSSLTRKEIAA